MPAQTEDRIVDPFADDLPSVKGDGPVVDASAPVTDAQIAMLQMEAEEGNEHARTELARIEAQRAAPKGPDADAVDEERSRPRTGGERRRGRPRSTPVVDSGPEAMSEPVPEPTLSAEVAGLSLEKKVDRILAWIEEKGPAVEYVVSLVNRMERESERAKAMYNYQCLECGQITQAPRPESRTSADQAVKCPNCFPKKGLTPMDVVEYREG